MDNRVLAVSAVIVLVLAGTGMYFLMSEDSGNASGDLQDYAGRWVDVPENLDNGIVTVGGVDPLRFVSYFNMNEYVIDVDKGDVTDPKNGRAYSYAYDYSDRTYHTDKAVTQEDMERIGSLNPSLIIVQKSVYDEYKENCEKLARSFNLVVIQNMSASAPLWTDDYTLNSEFVNQIDLMGKVLKNEKRAEELKEGFNAILKDIRKYAGNNDVRTYIAGVTFGGSNTLNCTFPFYAPLELVGGNNVYTKESTSAVVKLEIELIPYLGMDRIVIDPSSSDKISEKDSQLVLEHVYGVNNDGDRDNDIDLFVTIPMVWDGANHDCVLAGAYYMASLMYGTLTVDQAKEKAVDVFEFFYGENGTDVFDKMSDFFVTKSANNSVELPLLSEIKIVKNGNTYSLVAV